MKLYTPEGNEMMEVQRVERQNEVLIVRGIIMGTMPVRAVIRPEEIRAAFKLLSWGLIFGVLALLFRKSSSARTPAQHT